MVSIVRSFLHTSLDTSCVIIRDLGEKKKKRIAIADRFAFVRQQRTAIAETSTQSWCRALVRQGTRQGFYRGPKSLPLSRVETPK